jgi:cytochrome c2
LGSRLAVLIAIVLTLSIAAPKAAAGESCLRCHGPHTPEWVDCIGCHRGDPRSTRMKIAHSDLIPARFAQFHLPHSEVAGEGRKFLEAAACRRCHVWEERGNRLAADLDKSSRYSDPLVLQEAILKPVAFMPDFAFSEKQAISVVNALLAAGANAPPLTGERPQVIHFDSRSGTEKNSFVKDCGGCHRALTERHGGLGDGEVAPHLAGLLSEFYPRTFKEEEPWTRENLKKWLDNPRKSRPGALMAPVRLSEEEFAALVSVIEAAEMSAGQ